IYGRRVGFRQPREKSRAGAMKNFCRRIAMNPPRHIKLFSIVLLITAGLVLAGAVNAQGTKGTGSGRLLDSGGGILQGATILLEPGTIRAASDEQGEFMINGVPTGSYTVTISYVGLETYTGNVEVKSGAVTRVDQVLKVGTQAQSVIVTAERAAGEAEEVNRERTADNVVQVLSSDVIRSL